jgi:gamma-glutamylcyclotransferase (GGCT)/AIG2-like uncharacterized protein YtfP
MSGVRNQHLFSYGTLRQAQVQMASFGRRLEGHEDVLPGYRLGRLEITDPDVLAKSEARFHPIAEPSADPGDEVTGTVFEINEAELAAADDYEVPDYKRVAVRLKSGLVAWVYVRAG